MPKRRKTRTHIPVDSSKNTNSGSPKTFVVKSGSDVGKSLGQLVKDFREVMEPNTASRLRERKTNKLKDYLSMAGPLGVSHLVAFSQPSLPSTTKLASKEANLPQQRPQPNGNGDSPSMLPNMRLTKLPRGPTLSFKVLRYSLRADVMRMTKHPRGKGKEGSTEPILVLNGFNAENVPNSDKKALQLATTSFQNLFPPIQVQTMNLSSARRVVLLSYSPQSRTIQFRHYLIRVRPVGISKRVRSLLSTQNLSSSNPGLTASALRGNVAASGGGGVVDLSATKDIADYILRTKAINGDDDGLSGISSSGFASDSDLSGLSDASSDAASETSGSENEGTGKNPVSLPGEYLGKGKNPKGSKRAVGLVELGPRMELGLWKIESGVVGVGQGKEGDVLFHEIIHKSPQELATIKAKRALAAKRREEQEANVERKKRKKGGDEDQEMEGGGGGEKEVRFQDEEDYNDVDDDMIEEAEAWERELGGEEEEDGDLEEVDDDDDESDSEGEGEDDDDEEPEDSDTTPIPLPSPKTGRGTKRKK